MWISYQELLPQAVKVVDCCSKSMETRVSVTTFREIWIWGNSMQRPCDGLWRFVCGDVFWWNLDENSPAFKDLSLHCTLHIFQFYNIQSTLTTSTQIPPWCNDHNLEWLSLSKKLPLITRTSMCVVKTTQVWFLPNTRDLSKCLVKTTHVCENPHMCVYFQMQGGIFCICVCVWQISSNYLTSYTYL